MDRAHLAMEAWIVTIFTILAAAGVSAMAPIAPPTGRLLKVPKVYNALITSDIPLLPSRAETAATAAVGPVLLYSSQLPVILQPQSQGTTPQHHLDKLTQLQNQLQREDGDQQRQIQLPRCCIPQVLQIPVQQQLFPEHQLPIKQLFPERQVQQPYPAVKQLSVQQQLFPDERPQVQQPYPAVKQLPVQQQLFPERPQVQQPYPAVKQLPVQHQLFPERHLAPPVRSEQHQLYPERPLPVQLYPERQQLSGSHHQPLQVQQVPVQHVATDQQYDVPYQKPHQLLQQPYPHVHLQQKLQHQKQLQAQKQLQLSQFETHQSEEQDTSYLPMPEMNSYQPPPSVHIDDIKNNKPSNAAIPDVPPPPLPVGKRHQSYSYNSPGLSPPPPTNHHVPYG